MSKIAVFMAVGFEEIEAVSTIDVLRRGGLEVDMISVSGSELVEGAHGIIMKCNRLFFDVDYSDYDALVLPGGMPGTENLGKHEELISLIGDFYKEGKKIAAVCAAPTILGGMGLLDGREAICYPGMEEGLGQAIVSRAHIVADEQIITGRGAGVAMDFGLAILRWFIPAEEVADLRNRLVLP